MRKQVLMLLFILIGLLCVCNESKAATQFEQDGFVYQVNEDGSTVSLVRNNLRREGAEQIIPGEIHAEGKQYRVTKVSAGALERVYTDKVIYSEGILEIESLNHNGEGTVYFPASLQKLGELTENKIYVKKIVVAKDNRNYCVINNALCTKDKKTLIWLPETSGTYRVPSKIQTIKAYAFTENKLSRVIMPDSLQNIESKAFEQCTALKEVRLGKKVRKIAGDAFSYAKSLKKIIIPPSNKYFCVKKGAIYTKKGDVLVTSGAKGGTLTLSKKVVKIQEGAISFNTRLKKVVIKGKVKQIPDYCFACSGINSVEMPDSIRSIGKDSFLHCNQITTLDLPENLVEIKEGAFYNCGFYYLDIPEKVKKIGKNALGASIETLEFFGKKVPVIDKQEPCGYGLSTDPEDGVDYYVPFRAQVFPGIEKVIVPKKSYKQYKEKLRGKLVYEKMVRK